MLDTVNNRLVCSSVGPQPVAHWTVQLTRHQGHVYAEMVFPQHVFYTEKQLAKLHRQFAHASLGKIFNLLKRAGREHVTQETLDILRDIQARCDPCQRVARGLHRFRVSRSAATSLGSTNASSSI